MQLVGAKLAEHTILSLDGGPDVFYPYGFLRGYVVADAAFRPRIESLLVRLYFLACLMILADIAVHLRFGADAMAAVALCGIPLHYVCSRAAFRPLTKQLVPLPFVLGFRLYAQWCNERALKKQLICGLLGCLVFIGLLCNGATLYKIAVVVALTLMSIVASALLLARHQEARAVA